MTTSADAVRRAGLRATRPRLAVYDALVELGGHRTADELAAHLGDELARASVYNALRDLTTAGLVMVADTGAGPARHEVSDAWHHHFVCRECGRVLDVPCVVGAKPCLDASLAGAVVEEAQVIFRGRCPACAAR